MRTGAAGSSTLGAAAFEGCWRAASTGLEHGVFDGAVHAVARKASFRIGRGDEGERMMKMADARGVARARPGLQAVGFNTNPDRGR